MIFPAANLRWFPVTSNCHGWFWGGALVSITKNALPWWLKSGRQTPRAEHQGLRRQVLWNMMINHWVWGKPIFKQSHLFVRRRVSVMILMLISLLRHLWEFNHCENMQECRRMCSARSGAVSLLCCVFYKWLRLGTLIAHKCKSLAGCMNAKSGTGVSHLSLSLPPSIAIPKVQITCNMMN